MLCFFIHCIFYIFVHAEGDWHFTGHTSEDLINSYSQVFPHGNRNAASHRWAQAVLEEAESLSVDEIDNLFTSFCPVSGSPLRDPDSSRHVMELPFVDTQGKKRGFVHFCCWPCVCDANDLIKVDP